MPFWKDALEHQIRPVSQKEGQGAEENQKIGLFL